MEDLTRLENFTTLLKQTNNNNTNMNSENKTSFLINLFEIKDFNFLGFVVTMLLRKIFPVEVYFLINLRN